MRKIKYSTRQLYSGNGTKKSAKQQRGIFNDYSDKQATLEVPAARPEKFIQETLSRGSIPGHRRTTTRITAVWY